MNSLTALSRLLAHRGGRQSQLKRARRRSRAEEAQQQQQHQQEEQVEQQQAEEEQRQQEEAPVASTSASASELSDSDADADADSARKPTSSNTETARRRLSTRAAGVVANSLPIRMSVALLLCIRRILSRIFHIPFPPASSASPAAAAVPSEEEPPPSYEAATSASPATSSWRALLNSSPRPKAAQSVAAVEKPSEKHKRDAKKSAQVALLQRPKTLVLDLDETLIHSSNNLTGLLSPSSNKWSNLSVRVVEVVLDSKSVVYHVYKRPWVDLFLKKVAAWYTVVIFTASIQEYADPVIDWLDQGKGLITARLFRESCDLYRGAYSKNLSVISKDMSRLCLVDNSPAAYALNPANGIPIEGWVGDPNDESLLDLLPLLDSLRFTSDVRRVLGLRGFGRNGANPNSTSTTSMQV